MAVRRRRALLEDGQRRSRAGAASALLLPHGGRARRRRRGALHVHAAHALAGRGRVIRGDLRRRQPRHVDRPARPGPHDHRQRPGGARLHQPGAQLVPAAPAHRADVPRACRYPGSLQPVRQPPGRALHRRAVQHADGRRDPGGGVAVGGRLRDGVRHPGHGDQRRHLVGVLRGHPRTPPALHRHHPHGERLARQPRGLGRRRRPLPLPVDLPGPHLAARQQRGLRRQPACAPDHRRRPQLERDQPGPDARRHRQNAEDGRAHHRGREPHLRLRALRPRRVSHRARHHLGGLQRRPGARDARRRRELDRGGGQHLRAPRVGHGEQHRTLPLQSGGGVHHRRFPSAGRHRSIRLQDGGLRRVLALARRRHPAQRVQLRPRRARGPGAPRSPLPRNRELALRLLRRRGDLDVPSGRSASRAGPLAGDPAPLQRPGGGHLRARLLDPGRHHPAAAAERGEGCGRRAPVRAPSRLALPAARGAQRPARRPGRG